MKVPERVRDLIEGLLPWYDPKEEAQRDERSKRVHRFSIAARAAANQAMAQPLDSYGRAKIRR